MIKRECYGVIRKHVLTAKEITVIVGPRQSGKTTMLRQLMTDLLGEGKKSTYLNLDIEADRRHVESQLGLLKKIKDDIGDRGTVFIDEIQRKEDAGRFLKGIYDMDLQYKLVVTGSGSFELKEKIVESMAGRKRMFELSSMSLKEVIDFKTDYKYIDKYDLLLELEPQKMRFMLEDYLIYGGYPQAVLAESEADKRAAETEIFNSFLDRDISGWLGLEKRKEFESMCKILAAQTGQLLDISKLGKQTGLGYATVKKYLWYLEKTYIIELVRPFGKNKINELVRAPVVYFNDLGMRNFLTGQLYSRDLKTNINDSSMLFQNLIWRLLREITIKNLLPYDICYWRTKSGAEVDFVWGSIINPIPVEVKFSREENITRSLVSFIKKYNPKKSMVVNLEKGGVKNGVDFVPYWKLMDGNFGKSGFWD
ncbi:ATP-binding protein [Candidatus Shapirobacteria bacterium]|nr:ATP-binding protein [Candidatus Shapirobacteria bacterium]